MKELSRKNIKSYYGKSGIYFFSVGKHSYVGSSVNVGSRLSNHIWAMQNGRHRNSIIQNCYNKYSISGFTFKILEFCPKEDRIAREQYYIDLLKPDLNVAAPVTLKRDNQEYKEKQRQIKKSYYETHVSASRIPVYQYTKTGEYVTSFSSCTEAAEFYGVNVSGLVGAANGRSYTCAGYQWRKEKLNSIPSIVKPKIKKEKPKRPPKPGNKRKVYRYSLDGTYIDSFESCSLADRTLGIKGSQSAALGKGPYRSIGGYLWSYEKVKKIKPYENHSKDAKIVSIYVFDILNGNEIRYRSIADAVRELFPNCNNFDSYCASTSSSARLGLFVDNRYICRYEGDIYKLPTKCHTYLDNNNNFYITRKNIPANTEVISLITCAHNKLRESGKPFIQRQP